MNLRLMIFIGMIVTGGRVNGDEIVLDKTSILLQEKLVALHLKKSLSEKDILLLRKGLQHSADLIRIEAIKCVLLHRSEELWKSTEHKFRRGTSNDLAFLTFGVFETSRDLKLPLLQTLPHFIIEEAKRYKIVEHQRVRGGNFPIGAVLTDLLVKDVLRYYLRTNDKHFLQMLNDFELTETQRKSIKETVMGSSK